MGHREPAVLRILARGCGVDAGAVDMSAPVHPEPTQRVRGGSACPHRRIQCKGRPRPVVDIGTCGNSTTVRASDRGVAARARRRAGGEPGRAARDAVPCLWAPTRLDAGASVGAWHGRDQMLCHWGGQRAGVWAAHHAMAWGGASQRRDRLEPATVRRCTLACRVNTHKNGRKKAWKKLRLPPSTHTPITGAQSRPRDRVRACPCSCP